jgi:dipeptidyl aminopeptidase/acylaminoacyl peptidase
VASWIKRTVFGVVLLAAQRAYGQAPDGTILSAEACAWTAYDSLGSFTRRYYNEALYRAASAGSLTRCSRIRYKSGTAEVVGFVTRPVDTSGKPLPVILYARGGMMDLGRIDVANLIDFHTLASRGFVVLATQYRGSDGGTGREELGGSDVDDVVNLFNAAKTVSYADTANVFLLGFSRGTLTSLMALRRGLPVNAAALIGGIFDLRVVLEHFHAISPGISQRAISLMPDYASDSVAAYARRSATQWPTEIRPPLLLLHGTADEEVPLSQTLVFAQQMDLAKRPFQLEVYAADIHEVLENRESRDANIIMWFRQHLRPKS